MYYFHTNKTSKPTQQHYKSLPPWEKLVKNPLKIVHGSQLVVHCMPSSLCRVHKIPKESRFWIIAYPIFLNIVVHTPARVVTAHTNTTWLQAVPNVVRGRVVQHRHEAVEEVKNQECGTVLGLLV